MDEMRLLSREEWYNIGRKARKDAGCGPMRQLQLKIRRRPLSLGPQLVGIFRNAAGEVFDRLLNWPAPKGWRLAKEWIGPINIGFVAKYGVGVSAQERIDPLLDDWDMCEEMYGPDTPHTRRVVRKLIEVCLVDMNYEAFLRKPKHLRRGTSVR